MSRVLGENKTHLSTNTYGTISYMAPELLREGKLGKPADVYSFGILSARTRSVGRPQGLGSRAPPGAPPEPWPPLGPRVGASQIRGFMQVLGTRDTLGVA